MTVRYRTLPPGQRHRSHLASITSSSGLGVQAGQGRAWAGHGHGQHEQHEHVVVGIGMEETLDALARQGLGHADVVVDRRCSHFGRERYVPVLAANDQPDEWMPLGAPLTSG